MKRVLLTVIACSLAFATYAFTATATDKCTTDLQRCLNNWSKVRHAAWVGLDYDQSQPGVLKVKAVTPNSPAASAGFQPGDVIVAVNGAILSDKEALKKARGEWRVGQVVLYTVRRDDGEKQLGVTLGEMTDEVFAATVGQHMLDNHLTDQTAAATKK